MAAIRCHPHSEAALRNISSLHSRWCNSRSAHLRIAPQAPSHSFTLHHKSPAIPISAIPTGEISCAAVSLPISCFGRTQRTISTGASMDGSFPVPTVPPAWLAEHLGDVKVLDASWYMPAEQRQPFQEFQDCRIAGASFFDLEAIADLNTSLPHMLPTQGAFSQAASALGLSNSDSIVVYDGKGIFSAARAWWMFRVFGHDAVSVLEGGLPQWKAMGLPVEIAPSSEEETKHKAAAAAVKASYAKGESATGGMPGLPFQAHLQKDLVLSKEQVLENIEKKEFVVVDARSSGRFQGVDPEPRPGLSSGSIPGSCNVPFPKVLTPAGSLLCPVELESAFHDAGIDLSSSQAVAASCGTGVTACILALALHRTGKKDVPVYDGSWTEWASTPGMPIHSKQVV